MCLDFYVEYCSKWHTTMLYIAVYKEFYQIHCLPSPQLAMSPFRSAVFIWQTRDSETDVLTV